jgi:hypothetical protein
VSSVFNVYIHQSMGIEERAKRSIREIDRAIVTMDASLDGAYHAAIPAAAMDGALKVRLDQEYRKHGFDVEFAREEVDGEACVVVSIRLQGSSI